jgi:DNA-binding CsgD family transcriptional regulator
MNATCPVEAAPQFSSPTPLESSSYFFPLNHNDLLQAVLESWVDGVLILTQTGKWVQANQAAWQLCPNQSVPDAIWQACALLIESRTFYPDQPVVIETDVTLNQKSFRVRVRWFSVNETAHPYLMVVLEDQRQSQRNLAIAEVDRYHLSPREAEVWLLYRMNYRYKDIAQELYISHDTVKKHLKSIRIKQQNAPDFG